ncbi:glutaredoxin family protein [Cobetia sp. MMG027]|nr:glutaredoxin family protein [Cobetia sp. MMG027]MDA5563327.1 glutaredoxin family protein [Cobetia sp. MMG027]
MWGALIREVLVHEGKDGWYHCPPTSQTSVSGQVRTTRKINQHGSTAMKRVSLFTMANCPHCKTAKQYLEQQKIGFRLVDVRSPAGQKEFAKTGFRSVPVLKIGDQFLKGFSVKGFNQLYKG